jgi:ribosomal protein S27E
MPKGGSILRADYPSDGVNFACRSTLDGIRIQTDCPVCGHELNVLYKTMRLERSIECAGCGETVPPINYTPIGIIQGLIDEA